MGNMQTLQTILSVLDIYISGLYMLFAVLSALNKMSEDTEEVPPEVQHYSNRGEVPWDIQKYPSPPAIVFS